MKVISVPLNYFILIGQLGNNLSCETEGDVLDRMDYFG